MAATYICPTLDTFEQVFGSIEKDGKRVFELIQPSGSEAVYECKLRENVRGALKIKVYTSIAPAAVMARGVGQDAIRCVLVWQDAEGWERPLGKGSRVNRCGGEGSSAADVVKRALERARSVVKNRGKMPACPKCCRPMVRRVAKKTGRAFYGCVAWAPGGEGCSGSTNIPEES